MCQVNVYSSQDDKYEVVLMDVVVVVVQAFKDEKCKMLEISRAIRAVRARFFLAVTKFIIIGKENLMKEQRAAL